MRLLALANERDVGCERQVPRTLLPDVVEGVGCGPHVLAAARHGVAVLRGVKVDRAGMQNGAHIGVTFKNAKRRGAVVRALGRWLCWRAHQRLLDPLAEGRGWRVFPV